MDVQSKSKAYVITNRINQTFHSCRSCLLSISHHQVSKPEPLVGVSPAEFFSVLITLTSDGMVLHLVLGLLVFSVNLPGHEDSMRPWSKMRGR